MNSKADVRFYRLLFFMLGDLFLAIFSFFLSFLLRFDFSIPSHMRMVFHMWLLGMVVLKILLLYLFGLYRISWSFVGMRELANLIQASFISSGMIFTINTIVGSFNRQFFLPRSIILLDFILFILAIGSFRLAKRFYREILRETYQGIPVIIIGAGIAGERLVREFLRSEEKEFYPVAFVDDDPNKIGTRIHGIIVAGAIDDIPKVVQRFQPRGAIIAITTAKHSLIQKIFNLLTREGVTQIKVVPHISQYPERSISIKDIQDIQIEDLLYREPVVLEEERIRNFFAHKTLLITGGAGSIGAEIVRQALRFHPDRIIIFEIDETELFHLMLSLKEKADHFTSLIPYLGDVSQKKSLETCFTQYKPQIVFHAAAYKHVPMMEMFPKEAIRVNVLGTYHVAQCCIKYHAEVMINISTDKAVKPTSIMGASKRLAELICTALDQTNHTRFISVRFGNVLASRGSVVPLFIEQIKKGGPVQVTHRDVERYFMTIPEAVSLVFQAASMGKGGEIFALDMGQPIKILRLAEDLIRLNKMEPYKDIPIEFIGLRPGEKLSEELFVPEDGMERTAHKKIFLVRQNNPLSTKDLHHLLEKANEIITKDHQAVYSLIKTWVPDYQGEK